MKKLLAILLVLAMIFSVMTIFTACDNDGNYSQEDHDDDDDDDKEGSIVGEWKAVVNMACVFNMMFENSLTKDLAKHLELETFNTGYTIKFTEDGKYQMIIDQNDFKSSMNDAAKVWIKGYKEIIKDTIAKNNLNMTVEQYAQQAFGCSVEDYINNNLVNSMDTASFESSGEYTIDSNKLYMDSETEFYTVKVTTKKLEFTSYSQGGIDEELLAGVIFKRQ